MTLDILLCTGMGLALFGLPATLANWADRRPLWRRLVVSLLGLSLMGYVSLSAPATHSPSQWADVIFRVIAAILG